MNRIKRDYCSKGRHPRWRAWYAKYDMATIAWPWLGNFCTYCDAKLNDTKGSGPPKEVTDKALRARERILELRWSVARRSLTSVAARRTVTDNPKEGDLC